jgi:predicted nucleic acid-binding protein
MSAADRFLDTNILLYLLSSEQQKADKAERLIAEGGTISVQVLNEFASVATRKLGMSITEVRECLAAVRAASRVVPLATETHDLGLDLAERHGFAIYDAFIVAAALGAGCKLLLSEDLQAGRKVQGLTIRNPFDGE